MSETKRLDWQAARDRLERARIAIEADSQTGAEVEALLQQRAAALASPVLEAEGSTQDILTFRLASNRYAVPLEKVVEVTAHPVIAPAPGSPPEIAGLMQVRGEIRVVWDLLRLLGLPAAAKASYGSVALLLRTAHGEAAVLVDEVDNIESVNQNARRPVPDGSGQYAWMTEDLIVVVDTERLWPGENPSGSDANL